MYKLLPKSCKGCGLTYMGSKRSVYCSLPCSNKHINRKGHVAWNKGLEYSEDVRKKISESGKLSYKNGRIHPKGSLGYKHTEEWKLKMRKANSGELSPSWQGGITKLKAHIRNCFKYRQWRSDIFTINDFTCQECGQKGGRLHADHIEPFSAIIAKNRIETFEQAIECEELWSLNNGRTLCVECHKKTDTYLSGAIKYKKAVLSPLQLTA